MSTIATVTSHNHTSDALTTHPLQSALESIDLFPLIADSLSRWQIHRCHVTEGVISQDAPMKLIYHYEQLDVQTKEAYPLQGNLLLRFDEIMTRARFAELLDLPLSKVALPWQLKFAGKLVVFLDSPEIALRLRWVNTLKAFEPVYQSDLLTAIKHAFYHWQLVDHVEIISKTPQVVFSVAHPALAAPWQLCQGQGFDTLPNALSITLQQFLHENDVVKDIWLTQMQSAAQDYSQVWQTKFEQ